MAHCQSDQFLSCVKMVVADLLKSHKLFVLETGEYCLQTRLVTGTYARPSLKLLLMVKVPRIFRTGFVNHRLAELHLRDFLARGAKSGHLMSFAEIHLHLLDARGLDWRLSFAEFHFVENSFHVLQVLSCLVRRRGAALFGKGTDAANNIRESFVVGQPPA